MIIDNIINFHRYASIHPLMQKAIDFIHNNTLDTLQPGKYQLQEDDLYVNVDIAQPKTKAEAKLEAHKKYIDIQLPLTITEQMGYTPLTHCGPQNTSYDPAKDIQFFDGEAETYLTVSPDMFTIFFPEDAHAPCIMPSVNKKIIIKMAL